MEIQLKEITIRELTDGYEDHEENGVIGYGGRLDIRPPFQREFIYKDDQRDAVIDTMTKNFPLNVMYWAVRKDNNFEIIDGQQRTISICQFVEGDFSFQDKYFHSLTDDQQDQILDYTIMVYLCSGKESEKLEWFKTINIAGEKLSDQELRNAVYSGSWVTDAKKYFSKTRNPAYGLGGKYLSGSANRQEYLETAIKWKSGSKKTIEEYMSKNQHEPNAKELWSYFEDIIEWVKAVFPVYRSEMKGLEWGFFYDEFKNEDFDPKKLEEEIAKLMEDEDVTDKKGIYAYVLTHEENHLNIRAFSPNQKREAYERQKGICIVCNKKFEIKEMEADHIKPWHMGGKTDAKNCQMLCREDNRKKSGK